MDFVDKKQISGIFAYDVKCTIGKSATNFYELRTMESPFEAKCEHSTYKIYQVHTLLQREIPWYII